MNQDGDNSLGGYSVLYIEDTPANLRLVSMVLSERPDIYMLEALEPVKGLELAREHIPDLILLDLNLPIMSGFEVLKELRGQASTSSIPVFAISANAMKEDIQRGLDAGFDDYISKPFDIRELLNTVINALESRA